MIFLGLCDVMPILCEICYMNGDVRKPVFGVSDQV